MSDPVDKTIKNSNFIQAFCLSIKELANTFVKVFFCFNEVTKVLVLKEINYINNKKATPFNTIPSKNLKISSECSADTLTSLINKSLTV